MDETTLRAGGTSLSGSSRARQLHASPGDVRAYLERLFPELYHVLTLIPPIDLPSARRTRVPEAVAEVVVGQMLSREAARAVLRRLREEARKTGCGGVAGLSHRSLLRCGLSARKARTIVEFSGLYRSDPQRYRSWRRAEWKELRNDVCSHWGLSDWSASMLAIFYFRHPDVFPESDGSICRAMARLVAAGSAANFQPDSASPYRTYLALYLWRMLDDRMF
jgi:DNA-3-methyladenine glycosylase II